MHDAVRGEVRLRRIKCYYFEVNHSYELTVTPEVPDVARRFMTWAIVYLWRRAVFLVQYAGMSEEAVLCALQLRAMGRNGGMPEGAVISAEDAWLRLEAGETGYPCAARSAACGGICPRSRCSFSSTRRCG